MDPNDLTRLNAMLDSDTELKEKIKELVHDLDKSSRAVGGALNKIHSTPSSGLPNLVDGAKTMLNDCAASIAAISAVIPEHEYWRWNGLWNNSFRQAIFSAILVEYVENGSLLSLSGVSEVLGVKREWENRFTVQAEDYLHGVISVVNELSRWAVNAVTLGDFERPIRISKFVKDVFAGFSLLNFKNDGLRRRFDSFKYDMKKIEEVVYDVSLRRLAKPSEDTAT